MTFPENFEPLCLELYLEFGVGSGKGDVCLAFDPLFKSSLSFLTLYYIMIARLNKPKSFIVRNRNSKFFLL